MSTKFLLTPANQLSNQQTVVSRMNRLETESVLSLLVFLDQLTFFFFFKSSFPQTAWILFMKQSHSS